MWVKLLIGRDAGRIVDLPLHAAQQMVGSGQALSAAPPSEDAAVEMVPVAAEEAAAVEIPGDWHTYNAASTVDLARRLGAGDDVGTKAEARTFIEAEISRRAAA